jgi:hypothetical protein
MSEIISTKTVNRANLKRLLDPDFVLYGHYYYLILTEDEHHSNTALKVKVSAGDILDKGSWEARYFCIKDDQVVYVGRLESYNKSWFLVKEEQFEQLNN